MNIVRRMIQGVALIALCSGMTLLAQDPKDTHISYDQNFAFNGVKTYSWAKVGATNSELEPRMTAAVDHMLQGLGWKLVQKDATLEVAAIESDDGRGYARFYRGLNGYTWQRGWSNGGFADETTSLRGIAPGTLVLDMYNPADKKLVWRGLANEPVDAKDKAKKDDVDKSVQAMFSQFPPKSGGPMSPNQVSVPSGSGDTPVGTRP